MRRMTDPATTARSGPILTDAQRFWRLPPDKLDRMLALTRQADRMELKLVVPPAAHRSTCESLGVDFARLPGRSVYYFDTPDLLLERHGVVARARSLNGKPDDSVVKLRPIGPDDLTALGHRRKRLVVEVDAMPGAFVCTGALKRRLGRHDVARTMTRGRPWHTLFSSRQLSLLPADVRLDDLVVFGPVDVRRGKVRLAGLDRMLSVERWSYPDGSAILELSTRCPAETAVPVAAQLAAALRTHGVDITGFQQTKTKATLAYFGRMHRDRRRRRSRPDRR
jgi:hypothetical protein